MGGMLAHELACRVSLPPIMLLSRWLLCYRATLRCMAWTQSACYSSSLCLSMMAQVACTDLCMVCLSDPGKLLGILCNPASLPPCTVQAEKLQKILEDRGPAFLETFKLPLLTWEEAEELKRSAAPALESAKNGEPRFVMPAQLLTPWG